MHLHIKSYQKTIKINLYWFQISKVQFLRAKMNCNWINEGGFWQILGFVMKKCFEMFTADSIILLPKGKQEHSSQNCSKLFLFIFASKLGWLRGYNFSNLNNLFKNRERETNHKSKFYWFSPSGTLSNILPSK